MEYVYIFAFDGEKVMLVRNKKRGWEAPGGKLQEGEGREEGAQREFLEETGHMLEILCYEFFEGGHVFYGIVGERVKEPEDSIDSVSLFEELPDMLAFPKEEYEVLIERGKECLKKHRARHEAENDRDM